MICELLTWNFFCFCCHFNFTVQYFQEKDIVARSQPDLHYNKAIVSTKINHNGPTFLKFVDPQIQGGIQRSFRIF